MGQRRVGGLGGGIEAGGVTSREAGETRTVGDRVGRGGCVGG